MNKYYLKYIFGLINIFNNFIQIKLKFNFLKYIFQKIIFKYQNLN